MQRILSKPLVEVFSSTYYLSLPLFLSLSFIFVSLLSTNIDLSKFLWKIGVICRETNISTPGIERKGQKAAE